MDLALTSRDDWEEMDRIGAAFLAFLEGFIGMWIDSGISGLFLLDIDRVLAIDISGKSECCANNALLLGMLCCERKLKNKNGGGLV